MRRFIRRAFVGLLAVALVASGSVLGASSHAATHDDAPHAHQALPDVASVGTSEHHHNAQHESAPQNHPDDHKSKTCCTMCTISSPLPLAAHFLLRFEVSPAEYLSQTLSGIALTIAVDPEIPKRAG